MPGRIFLGNLSFNLSEADVRQLFDNLDIPIVSIKVMRDRETGKSRGFGFVELAADVEMDSVIKELNGKVVDGRALTVNEARPQARRDDGGFRGRDSNR
jgi:RNA recognition motif-containing protein